MLKNLTTTVKKNKLLQAEYSAISVAKYLLSLDPKREYFNLDLMSRKEDWESAPIEESFRLNKLLHICQMLYCAKYKKPLFKEQMLSFEHGAVVEIVRTNFVQLYSALSRGGINLLTKDKSFIKKVFNYFRTSDNEELENFSHDDPAWKLGKEAGNIQAMPLDGKLVDYYADFLDDLLEEVEK
jgi:uncharacterized phage-associated protein